MSNTQANMRSVAIEHDLQADYLERVYAGVLGKIIGVYLGRPFEGWFYRSIMSKLGPIEYYVHERLKHPLVVADDDISGTFTFLRALEDYPDAPALTADQIAQTWLNYIIENRTILWWGGMGTSTEHTAFLRLKHGLKPPASGSIHTNGKVVAEQIGSQIFIDGWGLVNPGDPERAAAMAAMAASVSHDGEAIYGAQVIAALVAQAFEDSDVHRLVDTATSLIPPDSVIAKLIRDVRNWHAEGLTWEQGFEKIEAAYGYDKFGGGCHIVPNHALVIHALLHGKGDFQRSLMVANTCGWDTDCNSGNVGCILGVMHGLAGIDAGPDWRGPVADRMIIPTADGGRCITDAAAEAIRVVNMGRSLRGLPPIFPKDGARFHFELPGSVQGFSAVEDSETRGVATVTQATHHGSGRLAIRLNRLAPGRKARVLTDTFPSDSVRGTGGYGIVASPTLYPGQTVKALITSLESNSNTVEVGLLATTTGNTFHRSDRKSLAPGESAELAWTFPDLNGNPCMQIGIECSSDASFDGVLALDRVSWEGAPNVVFRGVEGTAWRDQWVNGVSEAHAGGKRFSLVQNEGTGMYVTGAREWTDYIVESSITPHLCVSAGIAARVQGMKRYYALVLRRGGGLELIKALDGEVVLCRYDFQWQLGETHKLSIQVQGNQIACSLNGIERMSFVDETDPLSGGGIGFVLTEGRIHADEISVRALSARMLPEA